MKYIFVTVISVIIGIVLGYLLSSYIHKKRTTYGTLKVETDDPDGPFLFLEMSPECMSKILDKDTVILDVEHISPK